MSLRRALLTLGFLLFTASAVAASIDQIASQVSQSDYTAYLNSLYTHDGDTRWLPQYSAQHDLARDMIFDTFAGFGLSVSLDPFLYNGSTHHNVVAVQPGLVTPGQVYIVGAHYDSVNSPGADDNASGVAAILEAASVLSQYQFESTLTYIAFDREEQGLYGSTAYAAEFPDGIQGMISLDMIAYNDPAAKHHDKAWLDVYQANDKSLTIRDLLAAALSEYGGIETDYETMGYSDHEPFAPFGSVLLIEHAMDKGDYDNLNYHTPQDSVDTPNYIDYGYATAMTRGTVAFLAGQAMLVPEPSTWALAVIALVAVAIQARRQTRP